MTVESQVSKTQKMVMGATNTYDFFFHCLTKDPTEEAAKQAIKVSISDGVNKTELTYGTDYTVKLNDDGTGGTVTVADKRTSAYSLIVYREYDYRQSSDYQNYNAFPADTLEHNLDKATMLCQQLQEQANRAVTVDVFSDTDPAELVDKVETLYADKDNLDLLADNLSDIKTDAENIGVIKTAANNIGAVQTVSGSIEAVKTVSDAVNDVVLCAAEIAAIKDAPNQAAAASVSASAALVSQQQAEAFATAAFASETAAAGSRAGAAASESKAREYAVQAVRRNVGDVFLSLRSGDELNGAVECDGAVYRVADFAGENAVPALLAAGALPYVSMAEHDLLINGDQTVEVVNGVAQDGGIVSAQYGGYFKPAISDVPFSTAESWEFETKLVYKNFGGASARAIFASGEVGDYKNPVLQCTTAGVVMIFLSSNGTSWNLASNVNSGLTLADGTEYRLKFGFDGAAYYLKYKTSADDDFVAKWSLAKTDKIVNAPSICLLNSLITAASPNTYWNGSQMSLPDTALTIDGVEVWRGSTGRPAGACPWFGWDGAGSATFAVPKTVPRVLIASKEPSGGDQSWFNLYSDGWLEQGGYSAAGSVHEFCRLQKAYRDTGYTVVTVSEGGTGDSLWSGVSATPKTVDSFQFSHRYTGRYVAYGYADVPEGLRVRAMVQLVTGAADQAVVTATSVLPRMNKLESRFKIVSVKPAEPDPDAFYYIVGE